MDAPSIDQELIKYDERMRNTMGATALDKGKPPNGALRSSAGLPPTKHLSQDAWQMTAGQVYRLGLRAFWRIF